MELRRYRITGTVQGVGFRPFIHRTAVKNELRGWVVNDSEGVLLEVEGKTEALDRFIDEVNKLPPPMAQIDQVIRLTSDTLPGGFKSFLIKESKKREESKALISPDLFVCDDCVRELLDPANRRYRYPFINCTNCGPRYSIIKEVPYDRLTTTMESFAMCPECKNEYLTIESRRYHAQPNACPACGPRLELRDRKSNIVETDDAINFSKEELKKGKIFAIKSTGGFHLVANALDSEAIGILRNRKNRKKKPFAIMVKNIEIAQSYARLKPQEMKLLESVQRPIVLASKIQGMLPEVVAPDNPCYGLMLPSNPLQVLLLEDENLPVLIMTSGNLSGQPIVYKNEEALLQLKSVADYFLLHNRKIHLRIDDSIVRCTTCAPPVKTIVSHLRRARGFVPNPIKLHKNVKKVLAYGSELKATIALSKNSEVFISQHIGDVKEEAAFVFLHECSEHLKNLTSVKPEIIACDAHPAFRTTTTALAQTDVPVILVQHHHAHMAACMAENKIESKVIGVIFDGAGYGLDGTVWGGEILLGDYSGFDRVGCIMPFFLLGGDKAVEEPYRIAIELLYRAYGEKVSELKLPFLSNLSQDELVLFLKMSQRKINSFQTTSMGRLFDGISAILNICLKIDYEAQAAIELEAYLNQDFTISEPFSYEIIKVGSLWQFDYRPMVREIVQSISEGQEVRSLCRRFHTTIVDMVGRMCFLTREYYKVNDVVISGGVFMNEYLMSNTFLRLQSLDFNVYYHSLVPTNDGGISLGQVMVADAKSKCTSGKLSLKTL